MAQQQRRRSPAEIVYPANFQQCPNTRRAFASLPPVLSMLELSIKEGSYLGEKKELIEAFEKAQWYFEWLLSEYAREHNGHGPDDGGGLKQAG